jgi:GMP synthase-like glutamine amidotransferase
MSKVLILQNAPLFTAGSFEEELKRREIPHEYRKIFEGIKNLPSPDQVQSYSGIIVLGGPLKLKVDDPEKTPWVMKEVSLLRACLDAHKPILGVGQGGNLLANAQGAWIEKGPQKEIGWIEAEIYPDYSRNSVVYSEFKEKKIPVFCWYDTINGFPPQGYWYVLSPNCRYQSVGIHGNCYCFNFHPEVTEELIEGWLKEYGHELPSKETADKIRAKIQEHLPFNKRLSRQIIHAFQSFLK